MSQYTKAQMLIWAIGLLVSILSFQFFGWYGIIGVVAGTIYSSYNTHRKFRP